MSLPFTIREVTLEDAEAIADIYNHYIKETTITFELKELSVEEMAQRIERISHQFPYLVATHGNKILGYAYANTWKTREAYKQTVETSVYLHPQEQGRGLGTALYAALLKELKESNFQLAIGGITLPNETSIRLHEKLGFQYIGKFSKVGYKFNKWLDVGYWECRIQEVSDYSSF
jgi:L-amino acid N-acyltransferase YncA